MLTKIDYKKKLLESPEYQQGVKDRKEGKLKNEGVPFKWYRKTILAQAWTAGHYADKGYTMLRVNKNNNATTDVDFAFISTNPNNGHLECDYNDLKIIQAHREGAHSYPQPLELKV